VNRYYLDSPLGLLKIDVDDDGCVHEIDYHSGPEGTGAGNESLPQSVAQLLEYFAGDRRAFDLKTSTVGTRFQQQVWQQIAAIPFGQTRTYGELAAAIGKPTASRAVGAACGRNPISIVVPCHRVVGVGNRLTGYAGGVDKKAWLLAFEQRCLEDSGRVGKV